jgi:O-antigen ligase
MTDSALPPPGGRAGQSAARRSGSISQPLPAVPPWALIGVGLLSSVVVGALLADHHVKYGVGLVLVACYGPLVFFNFRIALAVWVSILFFGDLSVLAAGPNAVGVLIGLGWLGFFVGGRSGVTIRREQRRLLLIIAGFCLWLTLTIAWAANPSAAATEAAYWWLAALAFLIILTSVRSPQDVGMIAIAFVVGAVVSVLIGLATGSLESSTTLTSQTAIQGRFTGGGGDPNEQAAAFVAAMFLLIGLFAVYRRTWARVSLALAFLLMAVGFFATQSRGGLIALAVATLAAFVIAPRQRARILGLAALLALAGGILVAATPGALSRITDVGGGTSGRNDLWRVAWQVFKTHPFAGVGAGNFQVVEAHYVLSPGGITRIQYFTDTPLLVHNTFLQLLAETGVLGLAGFLAVVVGSLWSGVRAARLFEELGRSDYADLTRSITMGTVGMLTALFFISDGDDLRLWVLFGLGPALWGIATRARAKSAAGLGVQAGPRPRVRRRPAASPAPRY